MSSYCVDLKIILRHYAVFPQALVRKTREFLLRRRKGYFALILLAVIIVGKQFIETIVEMMMWYFLKHRQENIKSAMQNSLYVILLRRCKGYFSSIQPSNASSSDGISNVFCFRIKSPMQWVKDFKLVDFGNMGLFPEYLEMGKRPKIYL